MPTPNDRPTIGYGMTVVAGKAVKLGDVMTQQCADAVFTETLNQFAKGVESMVKIKLTQGQFDALVSLAYNIGLANLSASTLIKMINSGNLVDAADQFLRWDKQKGVVLPGLTKRRIAERKIFLS